MADPTTWKQMAFYLRALAGMYTGEARSELLGLAKACDALGVDLERLPCHRKRTSTAATS
jgi:hypothetical protein